MEAYMTQISNYLLRQSWQIVVLVAIIAMADLVLKNRSAHIRYLLWLIVLAKCLVPPLFTVPLAVLPEEQLSESTPVSAPRAPAMVFEETDVPVAKAPVFPRSSSVAVAPERATRFTLRQWLGSAWVAGVAVFLLCAAIKALRTNKWLRRQREPLPTELKCEIKDMFSDIGVRKFPKVWLVEGIGQPFVWGLLRGGIYLPAYFVKANQAEQRKSVLGHELCHVLRFDAAVNLLQVIVQILFWFHPLVWWANKRIRAEREKCCDEMTIERLGANAKDYSKAIVNVLISEQESTRPIPSLAVAGPVKNIEERIKTMLRPGKKFHKHPSVRAIAVLLIVALLTIPIGWGLTSRARAEASEPQEKPSKSWRQAVSDADKIQIKLYLAQGADVNAKGRRNGDTPLHVAVKKGKIATANLLIQKGADVNAKNSTGITPLHVAAQKGDIKMANLLILKSADVNAKNKYGLTPVSRALLSEGGGRLMVELLVSKGAKVFALHLAAHRGDIDKVRSSLEKGANVDVRDKAGHTPLFYAASAGQMHVIEFLISKGADVNPKDNRGGETPLFYAGDAGWKNAVELLIAKGADVNARGHESSSALASAAWLGRSDVAELLIAKGADVNVKSDNSYTPLHAAAQSGLVEIVEMLISKGSDVDAKNEWGETPLHSAILDGQIRVVQVLIANGSEVNAKNKYGLTPLYYAQKNGYTEIVELLLKQGAKE